jgi:hypothetical protein
MEFMNKQKTWYKSYTTWDTVIWNQDWKLWKMN